MNREIKFRAWDKCNGCMYYQFNDSVKSLAEFMDQMDSLIGAENDIVFMEYTGLKDQNGKEIYEGDIFEFDRREWGGDDNIHVVKWDDKEGSWSWGGGTTSDMVWRKIIGNIYETPEMVRAVEDKRK